MLSLALFGVAYATTPLRGPDFDGDGFEDSAVSGPSVAEYGETADGEVWLLYGSSFGLVPGVGRTDQLDLTVSGTAAPDPEDARFGDALAWGDFNGDCLDDLVVTVPRPGGEYDDAVVAVYPGSPTGPDPSAVVFVGPLPAQPGTQFTHFANAVAAGDFDGDGRDDLAIAGFGKDGRVQIHYGGTDARPVQIVDDTHPLIADPHNGPPGFEEGDIYNFGKALATGDFNCDGFADLAVSHGGGVFAFYGSADGLDGAPEWPLTSLPGGTAKGHAMTSGNFNNDASGDLACDDLAGVGSQGVPGDFPTSELTVVYGTAEAGLQTLSPAADVFDRSAFDLTTTAHFHPALTAGRFDADDYEDLALSSTSKGNALIVRGTSQGLITSFFTAWQRGDELPGAGESLGHGLGAGNYDGDTSGQLDLLLGTPLARLTQLRRAGVVFVVDTAPSILPTIDNFYAWTASDLGTQDVPYAELGRRSLPSRRKATCSDTQDHPFGFGGQSLGLAQ